MSHTYDHPPIAASKPGKRGGFIPVLRWIDPATQNVTEWQTQEQPTQEDAFHAAIKMLSKLLDIFYRKEEKS